MEDAYPSPSTQVPNNKKYLFIGLFLVVIVMFLATITFIISRFSSNSGNTQTAQNSNQNGSNSISSKSSSSVPQVAQSAPQVKFEQWIQPTNPPSALSSSSMYAFKQNYTSEEITALAKNLHADKVIKPNTDMSIAYTQNSPNDISALKFNPKTGTFSYLNTQGLPISTNSATIDAKLYTFLQQINWYDSTVKITAHYKKENQPGLVFYELHRDWTSAGLPILNFNGLFNINEDNPLNSLNYTTDNTMPADNNIYATSDHKDGFKRADDFNTITLAISDDNTRLISINSNLRQLIPTNTKTVPLISYAAALQKLKNNQYKYIFTTPSGSGQIPWSKIYPENKAIADQAIVSEARYAYLEQFPSEVQTDLKPYLLFRGSAALNSGYSVNFIAAVDVTSSTTASAGEVLGAHTFLASEVLAQNADSGNQIGKIGITPIDITPPPSGTVTECQPKVSDLNPTIDYTDPSGNTLRLGLGNYVRFTSGKGGETRNEQRWYYIPPNDFNTKSLADRQNTLQQAFNTFTTNIAALEQLANPNNDPGRTLYCPDKNNPGHTDKTCKRTWDFLLADFMASQEYFGQTCPIIFSGLSPAIFIYGKEGMVVDVRSWASLTYADPSTKDSMWHVKIGHQGELNVNDSSRQYIYYEYAPVTFNRPALGWNISKANTNTFVNQISKQLQLTLSETTRLQYEIQNAANNVNSNNLFIGLIDQQELNSKIPLSVYPVPQSVQRIHFYVGKPTTQTVKAPQMKPVERKEFMVLEFGAVPGK